MSKVSSNRRVDETIESPSQLQQVATDTVHVRQAARQQVALVEGTAPHES